MQSVRAETSSKNGSLTREISFLKLSWFPRIEDLTASIMPPRLPTAIALSEPNGTALSDFAVLRCGCVYAKYTDANGFQAESRLMSKPKDTSSL